MTPREPVGHALPRFSVTKPVTVTMILLTMLVVGFIAYIRVPLAMFPEGMENNALYVWVQYPNATPRDIEEKIARPLEDIIGTVPNVKKVNSWSNNGFCQLRIEFQHGTNLRTAYAHISDRMDRVKPSLPSDVDKINLRRFDQNDIPIMALVAGVPADVDDAFYRIENFVKPALQRIEGVGNVEVWGIQTRNVFIDLSEERLRTHRVDVNAMMSTLRNQNFALTGGYVVEGGRKIYVRSLGRLESTEQIGALIVDRERRLRLSDVANVSLRLPKRDWAFRVDGKPAIGMEITREATGNIERISREVRETLAQLGEAPHLADIKFNIFWDQGRFVKEAIENLQESGLWGGLFAAIVLYIFLRAPRMTAILTLAIPLSLLCTLIVLFFMGWSLNMATMMGLLLAVGMVVDNAIVIVENIYRYRQEGREATAASIGGAGEVALAVVMSTMTSVVVFLPLMLMKAGGDFSFWMMRIGIPVIVSLLASLFIALVFVPLAAQRLTRGHQHTELRVLQWIRAIYLKGLHWVLSHRLNAALLILVACATPWLPFKNNRLARPTGGGGGGPNENTMWMFFELPTGSTFEEAEVFFTKVEEFMQEHSTRYNFERIETRFRYNWGRFQMKFRDDPNTAWYAYTWDSLLKWLKWRPVAMDGIAIEKDFREKFPLPPGITMRTNQRGSTAGPQDSSLYLSLYGEDTGILMDLAGEAARRLRTIPGLISVDTDTERGGNELRIELDRDRARRLGVEPQTISSSIAYTMRGIELGRYYAPDGRELRINAQLGDADRTGLDDLRAMSFPTDSGVDVPLETLAEMHVAKTLGQIQRENRQTILRVVARAPKGDSSKLFQAIDKAMEGFEMPHGYRWDKGGGFRVEEDDSERKFAMILATTFVFLLMGLLFESFILPLAVIIAVPMAGLGVYWTLFFTGTPLDVMAGIGIVILVGVVVNNGIVLVDMTNRLRIEGQSRLNALLEAGKHRFRPIMMTTLTTVFGLVPMALGNSKMVGMPYAPLGRTMIGGLIVSTLLTLVVVPLFYTLLDDLREHTGRIVRSAFGRRTAATPAAGAATGVGLAGRAE